MVRGDQAWVEGIVSAVADIRADATPNHRPLPAILILARRRCSTVMAGPDPAIPATAVPAVSCAIPTARAMGMAGSSPAMTGSGGGLSHNENCWLLTAVVDRGLGGSYLNQAPSATSVPRFVGVRPRAIISTQPADR